MCQAMKQLQVAAGNIVDDVRPVTARESKVVKPDVTKSPIFNIQVKSVA